ncbi:hypothetical protein P9X10_01260 [Bacillus cereus]|nr:hypothetical protein [Bacillus cereus]
MLSVVIRENEKLNQASVEVKGMLGIVWFERTGFSAVSSLTDWLNDIGIEVDEKLNTVESKIGTDKITRYMYNHVIETRYFNEKDVIPKDAIPFRTHIGSVVVVETLVYVEKTKHKTILHVPLQDSEVCNELVNEVINKSQQFKPLQLRGL